MYWLLVWSDFDGNPFDFEQKASFKQIALIFAGTSTGNEAEPLSPASNYRIAVIQLTRH